jgi:hypothetical protein
LWREPSGNGDPIEVLAHPAFPVVLNGFTYHPQTKALLQWFSQESPSSAFQGACSYPDTTALTSLRRVFGTPLFGQRTARRNPAKTISRLSDRRKGHSRVYPLPIIDAIYPKVRSGGKVVGLPVLVAFIAP